MAHAPRKHWSGSRRLIALTLAVALLVGVPAMQFGQGVGRDRGGEVGGLVGLTIPLLLVGLLAGAVIHHLGTRHRSPGSTAQSANLNSDAGDL